MASVANAMHIPPRNSPVFISMRPTMALWRQPRDVPFSVVGRGLPIFLTPNPLTPNPNP